MIIWNTNLAFRASGTYTEMQKQQVYERESAAPDAVCLSYTHDRDYLKCAPHTRPRGRVAAAAPHTVGGARGSTPAPLVARGRYKEKPRQHAKMTRRAWCPPVFAAHDAPDATPSLQARGDGARRRAALLQRDLIDDEPDDDDDDDMAEEEAAFAASGEPYTDADAVELQKVIRGVLGPSSPPPPPEYEEVVLAPPLEQELEAMLQSSAGVGQLQP